MLEVILSGEWISLRKIRNTPKPSRVVIVGFRNDSGYKFKVPAETHNKSNFRTVKDALTNPPIKKNDLHHILTRNTSIVKERLSKIPEGKNIWNVQDEKSFPKHLRLEVKGAKLSNIYRRLNSKEPSYWLQMEVEVHISLERK